VAKASVESGLRCEGEKRVLGSGFLRRNVFEKAIDGASDLQSPGAGWEQTKRSTSFRLMLRNYERRKKEMKSKGHSLFC